MRRLWTALVLVGCSRGPAVLGGDSRVEDLEGAAVAVDEALLAAEQGAVVLRGRIGQICEEGCWFYLLGQTGVLYVKLNLVEGLVVPPNSEGREAIVKGELSVVDGAPTLRGETVLLY